MKKYLAPAATAIVVTAGAAMADDTNGSLPSGGFNVGVVSSTFGNIQGGGSPGSTFEADKNGFNYSEINANGTGCLLCNEQDVDAQVNVGEYGMINGSADTDQSDTVAGTSTMLNLGVLGFIGDGNGSGFGFVNNVAANGTASGAGVGDQVMVTTNQHTWGGVDGHASYHGSPCGITTVCDGGSDGNVGHQSSAYVGQSGMSHVTASGHNPVALSNSTSAAIFSGLTGITDLSD